MIIHKITALTVALATISITGCATHSEVNTVRNEVTETRRVADRALTIAEEANRRSERNEEMLNRGFRHSMRK
jgi:hypothetical protein